MLITGYHGTTLDCGNNIIKEGQYHLSSSKTEWLGKGVYFYVNFSDAFEWKPKSGDEKVVLHSVIRVKDDEFLDLDSDEGAVVWNRILDYICVSENIVLDGTHEENQCAVCKMIWDSNPQIKVIAASFATALSKAKVLIDRRKRRREFCVRDNESIRCTQIIAYRG